MVDCFRFVFISIDPICDLFVSCLYWSLAFPLLYWVSGFVGDCFCVFEGQVEYVV
jgi:hypothetical protein